MEKVNRPLTVAAIIPTFNRADLLKHSLESVLRQTYPPDEVIVVNDGSTDDTAALLETYGDRIRCIHKENAGKAAAVTSALSTLESDYVWIMDDDDWAISDGLARHVELLTSHPDIVFSYSATYSFEGRGEPPPLAQCHLWQRDDIPHAEFFIRAMEVFPGNLQTMLVPRTCYEAIGGLDESMTFGEDYDVILRLARCYRAGRLSEPTIVLRHHEQPRGPASERYRANERWTAWRLYDKKIFTKLRHKLALVEYLPRDSVAGPLTEGQTRQALLQRGCIMARHGLFEDALDDVRRATEARLMKRPATRAERAICGRMLDFNSAVLPLRGTFVKAVMRILRQQAPGLVRPAMAGLYWSLRRETQSGEYGQAARSGAYLARMFFPRIMGGL